MTRSDAPSAQPAGLAAPAGGLRPGGHAGLSVMQITWLLLVAGLLIALHMLVSSRMGIALNSALPVAGLSAMLLALQMLYTYWRPDGRIAAACGALTVMFVSSLLAAVISHASLRLGAPFVDRALSEADSLIGFHAPDIVLSFAAYPRFSTMLAKIYDTAFPLCFLWVAMLAFGGWLHRTQEYACCYVATILIASAFFIFMPALGSTVYHGVENIAGLPENAGNFHMATVRYYREDPGAIFGLQRISGIVTFPSFHMVMAILIPYSVRGLGWPFWLAVAWAALVVLSSIVIGGHYLVDLIGGAVVWAAAALAVHRHTRRTLGDHAT